ncbi:MAG: TAXI family TRAP transporter solute-binding subunit [Reyranella sp.]|uniref:TAXI family TRAP transporter solute-binding subunit n=1 Tax=Reyranella sp. TaxID=1929291 RepID=UPI00272F9329|nr:TAXI family TRAP transporter solute-binding subunit [Reyranella sp.]MDP1963570.1 TAXI family TRAP transporter solute-binding subunit [Reyranella sp.]MDP2378456.1 TAXI family TRAP transporter solute-binding subunit [Reyranella sp.]
MHHVGRRPLLAALPGLALVSATAEAQQTPLKLGTATAGGGFPIYGAAFINAVKSVDPTLVIEEVNTKGSTENVPLLEEGKLDLALVQGEVAQSVFFGTDRPPATLKVVTAMYASPGMFVVRADSRYRSIVDLKGQPIAWGARGSGLVILGRTVVDGIGLDATKDFEPVYLERAGDGPAMVIDGQVAALWGGGVRWPGFVAVANSIHGARFIVPTAGEIDRILAKYGFLRRLTLPAGMYRGQDQALPTVGSWSFVLARAGLPDSVGRRLAAALDNVERSGAQSQQLSETTAKNTLAALPRPDTLQPGVAAYYKELKLLP